MPEPTTPKAFDPKFEFSRADLHPFYRADFWMTMDDYTIELPGTPPIQIKGSVIEKEERIQILRELYSHVFRLATDEDKEPHWLYAIGADDAVKIGVSNDAERRLQAIQAHNHRKLTMLAKWKLRDRNVAYRAEAVIHERLSRFHLHNEWFKPDDETRLSIQTSPHIFPGNLRNPFAHPTEDHLQWWLFEFYNQLDQVLWT